MGSVLEMLAGQMNPAMVEQIGRAIGSDRRQTGLAIGQALPLLMGALSQNASRPEGADALLGALNRDHDGSILDDIGGFLGQASAGPGEGILKHVLGSRRPQVEQNLGQSLKMDPAMIAKLMTILGPIVLGALGRAKREQSMDANGLSQMLGQERQRFETRDKASIGLLGGLLDSDQDGDVDAGDLAKAGLGLVSKFLR